MTTPKSRTWPLAEAREVADALITLLRPACEKIEIAGSVRRQRPQVGDLELLAISKTSPANEQLAFDRPRLVVPALDARVGELITTSVLDYRLNKPGTRTYGPLNKLLVHAPSGISVDLFSTTLENWGMALVVRTGPKDFNIRMMARFKALGLQGHAYGGVEDKWGKQFMLCPTEEEVFRLLQWNYVPPEKRV
jgi:DNA polymerase/3'-5' exonuclease PolX